MKAAGRGECGSELMGKVIQFHFFPLRLVSGLQIPSALAVRGGGCRTRRSLEIISDALSNQLFQLLQGNRVEFYEISLGYYLNSMNKNISYPLPLVFLMLLPSRRTYAIYDKTAASAMANKSSR